LFGIPPLRGKRGDALYYDLVYRIFGVRAGNIELYKLALVHKSASVVLEDGTVVNNERLEFLGDAVIETVVSEMLFIEYPGANEGFLSKLRSRIVSRHTLNEIAIKLELHHEIVVHPSNLGQNRNNIYGDALEALVGALYLDKGYNRTNRVLIGEVFGLHLDLEALVETEQDFKSRIIEWAQKQHLALEFQSAECADQMDSLSKFETILLIGGTQRGYGTGRSKKEAEQAAAAMAYTSL
jgi:ribonuclease-3